MRNQPARNSMPRDTYHEWRGELGFRGCNKSMRELSTKEQARPARDVVKLLTGNLTAQEDSQTAPEDGARARPDRKFQGWLPNCSGTTKATHDGPNALESVQ